MPQAVVPGADLWLWMSHSVLCRLSVLRLVGAAHRAAVDLSIRDIPVWLWCGHRS